MDLNQGFDPCLKKKHHKEKHDCFHSPLGIVGLHYIKCFNFGKENTAIRAQNHKYQHNCALKVVKPCKNFGPTTLVLRPLRITNWRFLESANHSKILQMYLKGGQNQL